MLDRLQKRAGRSEAVELVRRRAITVVVPVLLVSGGLLPMVEAPPAAAACRPPDGVRVRMSYTKIHRLDRPTGINGPWVDISPLPGVKSYDVSFSVTRGMSMSASLAVTLGADAGVILAHLTASGTLTGTVTRDKSTTWSASANVAPRRNTMVRWRVLWINGQTLVTKKVWSSTSCKYVTWYSNQPAAAPRKADSQLYRLQYATLRDSASSSTSSSSPSTDTDPTDTSDWTYADGPLDTTTDATADTLALNDHSLDAAVDVPVYESTDESTDNGL